MLLLPLLLLTNLEKDGKDAKKFVHEFCTNSTVPYTLFDVGANNGKWSEEFLHFCQRKAKNVFMFEPNPAFEPSLTKLVRSHKFVNYIPQIAWFKNDTYPFFIGINSETSSIVRKMSERFGITNTIYVNSTDIRTYIQSNTHIFMKLDIEGGEYELLTHLMSDRLLCRLDYLLIEWHLNAMPSENRLACLGLRWYLSFHVQTLCKETTVRIFHSEYRGNNVGATVPGLSQEYNKRKIITNKWKRRV